MSTTFIVKMATTGVGFRWLDLLEKEFDKACVELETSLTELETEEPEVVYSARQKIATLSSCFAQLTHKALTIFQNSAKLEAELVDMRAELVQARAASAGGCQDGGDGPGMVPEAARARAEAAQLARENAALRETVLALHSELFGARLATKYLDKELAGRIQQLQLLGRDMRAEVRDSLWAQVEAEILLQRHKTLVRVCRGVSPRPAAPAPAHAPANAPAPAPPRPRVARPRTVRVRRSPHLGLGISVTGGREHGVPILISELEAGGPAALTGELYVGDAILAINDLDLTQACHKEAVQALQSVKGDCALCVQFIATDDDDRLSEDNYRFPLYPEDGEVFGGEADGSGATPTAPRTPDYNRRGSAAGSGSSCSPARCGSRSPSPRRAYPDYNSINNNLAILDMDDDTIKIEARLETLNPPRGYVTVGAAAGGASSSPDSPHSTPVHAKRSSLKKKRKPQDWRTKGAYRAVEPDAASSDEPSPPAPPAAAPPASAPPAAPAPPSAAPAPPPPEPPRPPQPPAPLLIPYTDGVSEPPAPVPLAAALPPPPRDPPAAGREARDADPRPVRQNGDVKPLRRESKGFRIGSARRVTEGVVPAPPGKPPGKPPAPAAPAAGPPPAFTNGAAPAGKFPHHLLPGDGDPDFGTPV